jgi:DNA-directed RNA polymerase beta' subunit
MENRMIKFHDKREYIVNLTIQLDDKNYFSISGEVAGCSGQVCDEIQPKTDNQKDLLSIWKLYHLKTIDDNTFDGIADLLDKIIDDEVEYTEDRFFELSEDEIIEVLDKELISYNDEKMLAIIKEFELCKSDALNVTCDITDCYYTIQGEIYLVVTDDEADDKAREQIEEYLDDELSHVPGYLRNYFDIDTYVDDVISNDGRGIILNQYNSEEIERNNIYMYRQ